MGKMCPNKNQANWLQTELVRRFSPQTRSQNKGGFNQSSGSRGLGFKKGSLNLNLRKMDFTHHDFGLQEAIIAGGILKGPGPAIFMVASKTSSWCFRSSARFSNLILVFSGSRLPHFKCFLV